MKRFFLIFAAALIAASAPVYGKNRFVVEDKYGDFINIEPQTVNGVFYVPVREMCENMGYSVYWDSTKKDITVVGDNKRAVINTDKKTLTIGNEQKNIDVVIMNSYCLIPGEVWSEIYNKYIYWDNNLSVGAVVTPTDITMKEYLGIVDFCANTVIFNSAYTNVKDKVLELSRSYLSESDPILKDTLKNQMKSAVTNDLKGVLDKIRSADVADTALGYKEVISQMCTIKYDYINDYIDHISRDSIFEPPTDELREEAIRQNLIVTAQLRGFFGKTAAITESMNGRYLKQVNTFSDNISAINEDMAKLIYHIDTSDPDINSQLIKYGNSIKEYAREYKIALKAQADTVFSDDTFAENVEAIDFILDGVSQVGTAYIECGKGNISLERARLQENYVDFVWENISMFVIAEHFGFTFDYIYPNTVAEA